MSNAPSFCTASLLTLAVAVAQSLGAQTSAPPAGIAGCYRLTIGQWSHPLSVNAAYHAIPAVIHLRAVPASRGGWTVSPDIAYPRPGDFPGMPRWVVRADTIDVAWSDGHQVTTVRLPMTNRMVGTGIAIVRSDANEFGSDRPHASVVAQRVSCGTLR